MAKMSKLEELAQNTVTGLFQHATPDHPAARDVIEGTYRPTQITSGPYTNAVDPQDSSTAGTLAGQIAASEDPDLVPPKASAVAVPGAESVEVTPINPVTQEPETVKEATQRATGSTRRK